MKATTTDLEFDLNDSIKSYLANDNPQKPKYKAQFVGMFVYPNKTHSVIHEKNQIIEVGSDFRDWKGILNIVTNVIETRDHKGVYEMESRRQKISIVESTALPKM